MNNKKMHCIAWDVDDVLNNLMEEWLKYYNGHYFLKEPINYKDILCNPPSNILGITEDQYLDSLDEFRRSIFYDKMIPNTMILDWLQKNGHRFRHIALTSVPFNAADRSSSWVMKNFGTWIRTFHFVPSYRRDIDMPEYDRNKCDFMKWIGKIDFFIDDNMDNVAQALDLGIQGFLIERPWNKYGKSISEILETLSSITMEV